MKNKTSFLIYPLVIMGMFLMLTSGCKKDDNKSNNLPANMVKDIDGNVYTTVTIGTQTWLVENLKVTKYRDGTSIPNVTGNTEWSNLTTGAYCDYDNTVSNSTFYGKLYNWYAVNDSRNIAPAGWHVPTDAECTILYNYVAANTGTSGSVAKSLAATINWSTSTTTGAIGNDQSKNNSSGFTALPAGYRNSNGAFIWVGDFGGWWSSTENGTNDAYGQNVYYDYSFVGRDGGGKSGGLSVRCLRDN